MSLGKCNVSELHRHSFSSHRIGDAKKIREIHYMYSGLSGVSLPPSLLLKILYGYVKNVPFCLHFRFRQPRRTHFTKALCYDLIFSESRVYLQGGWGGWPTGNGNKLSSIQAQLGQATCLAVA